VDLPTPLGIGLDPKYVVAEMTPGGAAARSGQIQIGDELSMVDGVEVRHGYRSVVEVLQANKGRTAHSFVLMREKIRGGDKGIGGTASRSAGKRPTLAHGKRMQSINQSGPMPVSVPPRSSPPSSNGLSTPLHWLHIGLVAGCSSLGALIILLLLRRRRRGVPGSAEPRFWHGFGEPRKDGCEVLVAR
jgi:hypothetical protein